MKPVRSRLLGMRDPSGRRYAQQPLRGCLGYPELPVVNTRHSSTTLDRTRPGSDMNRPTVVAEGWFGAANETTIWTTPPPPITGQTGGSVAPTTGSVVFARALIGFSGLLVVAAIVGAVWWWRDRKDDE